MLQKMLTRIDNKKLELFVGAMDDKKAILANAAIYDRLDGTKISGTEEARFELKKNERKSLEKLTLEVQSAVRNIKQEERQSREQKKPIMKKFIGRFFRFSGGEKETSAFKKIPSKRPESSSGKWQKSEQSEKEQPESKIGISRKK